MTRDTAAPTVKTDEDICEFPSEAEGTLFETIEITVTDAHRLPETAGSFAPVPTPPYTVFAGEFVDCRLVVAPPKSRASVFYKIASRGVFFAFRPLAQFSEMKRRRKGSRLLLKL